MSTKTDSANALRQKTARPGPRRIYYVHLITKDYRCIIAWGWVRARDSQQAVAMASKLAEERGHEIDRVAHCKRWHHAEFEREYGSPALRAAEIEDWEREAIGLSRNPFLGFLGFEEVTP